MTSGRLLLVDLLRTLAIAVVIAIHLQGAGLLDGQPSAGWHSFADNGMYGVYAFFVVSGFLISRQIFAADFSKRSDVVAFWWRRVARIWPLLALTTALGAILLFAVPNGPATHFVLHNSRAHFDWPFWASIPSFTFNWLRILRSDTVFGWGLHWDVIWSLAIEEQFYFIYPLLVLQARTRRKLIACLTAVIFTGAAVNTLLLQCGMKNFLWLNTNSAIGFASLAFGCLAYQAHTRLQVIAPRVRWLVVLLASALTVWAYRRVGAFDPMDATKGLLLVSASVALAVAFGADLLGSYREGEPRSWLVLPGKLSFGCYLLHPLALYLLWQPLTGLRPWPAFALLLLATLALAQLSWSFWEEPARKALLHRLTRTGQPR